MMSTRNALVMVIAVLTAITSFGFAETLRSKPLALLCIAAILTAAYALYAWQPVLNFIQRHTAKHL